MTKFLGMVVLLLTLAACSGLRPMTWLLKHVPEDAPPDYAQGWNEGCESGMGAMGNEYYKAMYPFKQDQSMITNLNYYKAWKNAFNYCRHYTYAITKEGNVRLKLPHSSPFEGDEGIGSVFNFGGTETGIFRRK